MTSDMPDGVTGEELEAQVRRQSLYAGMEQVLVASVLPVGLALVCAPFVVTGWISGIAVAMFLGVGISVFVVGLILAAWQSRKLAQAVSQVGE